MRHEVVFAPEADDQLEELFSCIADRGSVLIAERYTAAIVATCEDLSRFPHRAVSRDDIRPGLRVTHHKGRTMIAYAVDEATRRVTGSPVRLPDARLRSLDGARQHRKVREQPHRHEFSPNGTKRVADLKSLHYPTVV